MKERLKSLSPAALVAMVILMSASSEARTTVRTVMLSVLGSAERTSYLQLWGNYGPPVLTDEWVAKSAPVVEQYLEFTIPNVNVTARLDFYLLPQGTTAVPLNPATMSDEMLESSAIDYWPVEPLDFQRNHGCFVRLNLSALSNTNQSAATGLSELTVYCPNFPRGDGLPGAISATLHTVTGPHIGWRPNATKD